jgi:hypothetical protein
MNVVPRAHVSDAIKQLRGWVTLAAAIVGIACATQMMVFGFAAFTEVRWQDVKPAGTERTLRVVGVTAPVNPTEVPVSTAGEGAPASVPEPPSLSPELPEKPAATPAASARVVIPAHPAVPERKTIEPNRVKSASDLWMHRASDLAASMGVVAVVCLFVFTMLGAVVAGGGAVPGVERAVTSAVWSMILCLLCLPWSRALPGLGVQGIFASYTDMTWMLDIKGTGGAANVSFGLIMQWMAAPVCGMLAAMGVAIWFRAGVERGVLVNAPNELERAVVREAEMIQKRGVSLSAPKAVGALHQAIGGGGTVSDGHGKGGRGAPPGTLSAMEQALNDRELAGTGATATRPVARGKLSGGVADEDFRRPI